MISHIEDLDDDIGDRRVILHVYDLAREVNDRFWWMGVGIFHTGIEFNGKGTC